MTSKFAILSVVGAVAVAAAAAGGYAALRSNASGARTDQVQPVAPAATMSGAVVDEPAPAATDVTTAPAAVSDSPRAAQTSPAASPAPAASRARVPAAASSPAPSKKVDAPAPTPVPLPVSTPEVPAADSRDARFDAPLAPSTAPAKPRYEDLVVKEDSVIGIRLDSTVSTETAKVEDKVTAHVVRDVTVDGRTAIPANARLEGVVATVERGGKFKDRARLGIRFHDLLLADGTRLPIQTETIFREGESPTGPAASKVGAGAVAGTILGAVIGGKKGAAIGATVGAAGGTAAVMATGQNDAVLTAGTPLTVRLTSPVTVSIEKEER